MGRKVESYINKQKSPVKEICAQLRTLILRAFPGIKEEMKYGVPWYGEKFYIAAFKDHVNLGVSIEGLSGRDRALFDGTGRLMSHIKFFPKTEIDKKRTITLLKIALKSKCSCP